MAKRLRAAITGLGAAVPKKVLTNADFEKFLDTSDAWIVQRTGIRERRVLSDGETGLTLAVAASRDAMRAAGVGPNDLDLIICATVSPEMPLPATACFIQDQLGATDTPAFDLSAACSGFIYGVAVADQFIQTGTYRRALVVAVDTLSRFADYADRGSCILFGDAAGAAVLEVTDDTHKGVAYTVMHTDGAGWDYIHVPGGGSRTPASAETVRKRLHYIKMRGRDVYKFAVEKMQWLLGDCLDHCRLTPADVDLVIPHQVNIRIIKSATAKFDFPLEKVYINIDRYGNTSGASIPLAMFEAWQEGRIGPGSTVMLLAFGAGLTWAGAVIDL